MFKVINLHVSLRMEEDFFPSRTYTYSSSDSILLGVGMALNMGVAWQKKKRN